MGTLMTRLKKFLGYDSIRPITMHDVEPARMDSDREDEILEARGALVSEVMRVERKGVEIRRDLANKVLGIVSGERP